jgi:hypothetical protein
MLLLVHKELNPGNQPGTPLYLILQVIIVQDHLILVLDDIAYTRLDQILPNYIVILESPG